MQMQPFDMSLLIVPGLIIFIASWGATFAMTRLLACSLVAGLVKAGIFFVYFGVFFDGTYTFLDDWSYLEGGLQLYENNIGIANLADNWEYALMIGRGDHFVYYLYNAYAIRFFGEYYFAPVALNVLLSVLIAYIGTRLAEYEFGLDYFMKSGFFIFLLLHPDILSWSYIMNGKDIMVLLLQVLMLTSASYYFRIQPAKALLLAIPVSIVLLFLRFYVPLLFAAALGASLLFARKESKAWGRTVLVCAAMLILTLGWLGYDNVQNALNLIRDDMVNPLYGFIRFTLTPIPFNTGVEYAFLDWPALFHWLFFPFACWGVIVVHRQASKFSRFFLVYILTFLCLYSVYGELQGPRHRVQLDYAWAVLQFLGFVNVLRHQRWLDHKFPPSTAVEGNSA